MPASENSIDDLIRYGKRLKCFSNRDDVKLWGNYNSLETSNIVAAFDLCDPARSEVTCKSEHEIQNFLKSKYLVLHYNAKRFVQHKFSDERISAVSRLKWLPVSTESRVDYVFKIERATFMLNDKYFNIGGLTEESEPGWQLNREPNREIPYENRF